MKSNPLIGLVLLGIGIAIGWFARGPHSETLDVPAPKPGVAEVRPSNDAVASAEGSPGAPRGKSAIRKPMAPSSMGAEELKLTEEMNVNVGKMMESMAKRQRTRLDQHVERLNASVSLTPDQQQKITAWLDENMKTAGKFDMMSGSSDPEKAYVAQTGFSPDGLEEYLADMLSPDQMEALGEFQHRDKQGKVDALALKNLAQIQGVVEFNDSQRDQVYQILSEAAERKLSETSKDEQMMSFMHDSIGIEMDPYDLGVDTLMQDMMGDPMNPDVDILKDTKAMAQNMRDELERRIDAKVGLLQPALNEEQLEQYRTELRTRGGGFVEQMILGMEMMEDKDTK